MKISPRLVIIYSLGCFGLCLVTGLIGVGLFIWQANTVTDHNFPLSQEWVYHSDDEIRAITVSSDKRVIVRTAVSMAVLEADNGQPIWLVQFPRTPEGRSLETCGNTVVVSHGWGTNAYDLITGELLWRDNEPSFQAGNTFTAAITPDVVVTTGKSVQVRNLNSGALLWQLEDPLLHYGALAAIEGEHLYLILIGQIRDYHLATGELIWSVDTPYTWSLQSMLFEDGVLYLENVTNDGVAAFSVKTKEFLWYQEGKFKTYPGPIRKYNDYLFVPITWEHPIMLNAQTGEIVWKSEDTSTGTYLTSLVVDNVVYVRNYVKNEFYALDLQSGTVMGYLDLGFVELSSGGQNTGPFLLGDRVIFANRNRIFAYRKK